MDSGGLGCGGRALIDDRRLTEHINHDEVTVHIPSGRVSLSAGDTA